MVGQCAGFAEHPGDGQRTGDSGVVVLDDLKISEEPGGNNGEFICRHRATRFRSPRSVFAESGSREVIPGPCPTVVRPFASFRRHR